MSTLLFFFRPPGDTPILSGIGLAYALFDIDSDLLGDDMSRWNDLEGVETISVEETSFSNRRNRLKVSFPFQARRTIG
jgi:hypothetical protein